MITISGGNSGRVFRRRGLGAVPAGLEERLQQIPGRKFTVTREPIETPPARYPTVEEQLATLRRGSTAPVPAAPPPRAPAKAVAARATKADVIALQRALKAHGYVDERGKAVVADGVFGAHTVAAVNNYRETTGRSGLSQSEILGSIRSIVAELARAAQAAGPTPKPPAPPPAPKIIETATKSDIMKLQKALRAYGVLDERGKPVVADGLFGAHTVAAVNNFRQAAGQGPLTQAQILGSIAVLIEGLGMMIDARAAASRVRPSPTGAKVAPPQAKVAQLQRALIAARVPGVGKVDGKFGPKTHMAVNAWLATVGRHSIEAAEVIANLDELIKAIEQAGISAGFKTPQPQGKKVEVPTAVKAPSGAVQIGDFACRRGICVGMTPTAKLKATQFQTVLNSFPRQVVAQYPHARKIGIDGKIGNDTVQAARVVVQASNARSGDTTSSEQIASYTAETISDQIDKLLSSFTAELPLQKERYAGGISGQAVWTVTKKGNIVGNARFRCTVMALQVQLNRFGQNLVVEGVIGPNTLVSVQTVVGGAKWTLRLIAENLEALARKVKTLGDAKGYPPPRSDAGGKAFAKCSLEITQPVTDSRITTGGRIATGPTPAPPSKPTPEDEQPEVPQQSLGIDPNAYTREKLETTSQGPGPTGPAPDTVITESGEIIKKTSGGGPPEEGAPPSEAPAEAEAEAAAEGAPSKGLPWWGWGLIGLFGVGTVVGISLAARGGKKIKRRRRHGRLVTARA